MVHIEEGKALCEQIRIIKRKLQESRFKARTRNERMFIDSEIKRADKMLETRRRKMHYGGKQDDNWKETASNGI